MNEITSVRPAVAVMVGAAPPAHRTLDGHTTVRLPVPSCLSSTVNCLPDVAVGNVKVQLPVSVRLNSVPLHMIGELSKSTSWGTGIEQQSIGFVVYYMRPRFVAWEQALNRTLMSAATRQRFYFEFNADGLLRGDFKTRMEGYALLIQWGVVTINEVRRRENMPPVEGGDERMHPLNYAPASKILEVLMRGKASPSEQEPTNGA